MIRIVRAGSVVYRVSCCECECLLEYDLRAVEYRAGYPYITCPCGQVLAHLEDNKYVGD